MIRPYRHKKFVIDASIVENVLELHETRLAYEPNLNYLKEVRKRYDLNKDKKFLSLKIQDRDNQKNLRKNWLLEIENKRRSSLGFDTFASYEDLENFNKENDGITDANRIDFENDYQLIESAKIVNDYLNLEQEKIITMVN